MFYGVLNRLQKDPEIFLQMKHNITMASNKAEIIDCALEIIDSQEGELSILRQRQIVLISLAGFFFTLHMLF